MSSELDLPSKIHLFKMKAVGFIRPWSLKLTKWQLQAGSF